VAGDFGVTLSFLIAAAERLLNRGDQTPAPGPVLVNAATAGFQGPLLSEKASPAMQHRRTRARRAAYIAHHFHA
jgi:hypothetical protein